MKYLMYYKNINIQFIYHKFSFKCTIWKFNENSCTYCAVGISVTTVDIVCGISRTPSSTNARSPWQAVRLTTGSLDEHFSLKNFNSSFSKTNLCRSSRLNFDFINVINFSTALTIKTLLLVFNLYSISSIFMFSV